MKSIKEIAADFGNRHPSESCNRVICHDCNMIQAMRQVKRETADVAAKILEEQCQWRRDGLDCTMRLGTPGCFFCTNAAVIRSLIANGSAPQHTTTTSEENTMGLNEYIQSRRDNLNDLAESAGELHGKWQAFQKKLNIMKENINKTEREIAGLEKVAEQLENKSSDTKTKPEDKTFTADQVIRMISETLAEADGEYIAQVANNIILANVNVKYIEDSIFEVEWADGK